ncbi:hypothetical protein X961_4810 [Burkholderia pseudomallei MSHR5613]|nr:hypothetical protein X977_5002 [Burkholderia pseudomallei MSHR7504]KGS17853.1 hypothetical protein X989_5027 [Burkholderia pseudomallei MSHR4378]KGS23511.1 hypothetical protein X941_5146 [Burkholderia pseudomallei MSHR5569]KGS44792.1 hypothetical protein X961_4810 [Burkholderia pseudomallei MSHR5613]KGS76399.1 hypothetical protein X942_4959 [Burkholderia pseudomallei MSHR5596]KGX52357.1 hypothetical protein Y027_4896 [Burkholderia pseudomallei TSV5]KGX68260.1 hypothetical protein Y026_5277
MNFAAFDTSSGVPEDGFIASWYSLSGSTVLIPFWLM